MKKLLLFTTLCALIPAQQVRSMDTGSSVHPLISLGAKVGFGLAGAGATIAACTVAHELAHATTAYALFGSPINIELGSENVKKPLFKSKYFTINDYNIWEGRAHNVVPSDKRYTKKHALVSLSGPLIGITTSLLIARYTNSDWIRLVASHLVMYHAVQLLPVNPCDGYSIVRCCGLSEQHTDKLSDILMHPISRWGIITPTLEIGAIAVFAYSLTAKKS